MCSWNVFRICFRGTYSCNWKSSGESNKRYTRCQVSVLSLMSVITLAWLYVCFAAYNDNNDVNWKAFEKLRVWLNWYTGVIVLSAMLAMYCLLLLCLSFLLIALKEPLDLHWLHKVLLSVSLVIVMLGIAVVSLCWTAEWEAVRLLLQATAPFLHLAAVVALTMISWLVFQRYHRAQRSVSRSLIIGALWTVTVMVFISPLFIYSPCISYMLPPKPALVAHRGAPMLAPENTMMSFRRSVACHVTAFETDVQLSKDMVPFLMHDSGKGFLHRTTNVDAVFPNRTYNSSSDITWEELQMLNAGDWFVKTDPFWSVSLLSEQEKTVARNQTVTSLSELLELSKERNISLIFDLKYDRHGNCNDIAKVIQKSGISQDLIWWLHEGHRECVKKYYPGFHQVYPDQKTLRNDNGSWLNMKYSTLSAEEISDLRSRNVKVNLWVVNEPWLFSLLWCSGVSSVTTNSCHILKDMSQPDWHLTPHVYKIIWITADLVSLLLMFIFFLLQRCRCNRHTKGKNKQGAAFSSKNQKEGYPFLSSN
ncbi:glycerophosphoinositol inositolphosphodiesterase GDPD2 isoform X2 [Electrophorus electricus]|uniref:glycerophosphoinositol inositolphosphodiesterase GDPD2 isoform X2 n=1 Tax=Electrophorus electricus TaxID=8005 RepID=UPI0015D0AD1C|nr:glycerophosphoinositol inositolphosphodiesterase GDPD2 isoform X2 [Electrophorus electricus]